MTMWKCVLFLPILLNVSVSSISFLSCTSQAIPNPTSNGFKECGLTAPSTLCDTDGIFTTADRYPHPSPLPSLLPPHSFPFRHHLDHELKMFETRTRRARPWNIHAAREKMTCDDKGITPAIAVVRRGNAGVRYHSLSLSRHEKSKVGLHRETKNAVIEKWNRLRDWKERVIYSRRSMQSLKI